MKMAMKDGQILIREADNVQFTIIKSWGKMKWSRQTQTLSGPADIELLNRLAGLEAERSNGSGRPGTHEPEARATHPTTSQGVAIHTPGARIQHGTHDIRTGRPTETKVGGEVIHIKETEIIPFLKTAQTGYTKMISEGDLEMEVELAEKVEEALTQAMDIIYDYQSMADEHKRMVEKYETEAPVIKRGMDFYCCPACGKRTSRNHTHCHWCGKKLGW